MIGIIGAGNMGGALLNGILNVYGADEVTFFDPSLEKRKWVYDEYGVISSENNKDLASKCDLIILAVKPQVIDDVIKDIQDFVDPSDTIVSIAPGITTGYLSAAFDFKANIVRVMPNTPALIGEGMSAICFDADYNGDKEIIFDIFNSVGKTVELPERLMNAAVVANGSSPAFVYMFIEAMADASVKYGIQRDKAYEMVAQTVLGAAKMVLDTKKYPGELKDAVCSPGGTTICGVSALEENNFRGAVLKGCQAVFEKSESMKK